jgi:hypothetical protein
MDRGVLEREEAQRLKRIIAQRARFRRNSGALSGYLMRKETSTLHTSASRSPAHFPSTPVMEFETTQDVEQLVDDNSHRLRSQNTPRNDSLSASECSDTSPPTSSTLLHDELLIDDALEIGQMTAPSEFLLHDDALTLFFDNKDVASSPSDCMLTDDSATHFNVCLFKTDFVKEKDSNGRHQSILDCSELVTLSRSSLDGILPMEDAMILSDYTGRALSVQFRLREHHKSDDLQWLRFLLLTSTPVLQITLALGRLLARGETPIAHGNNSDKSIDPFIDIVKSLPSSTGTLSLLDKELAAEQAIGACTCLLQALYSEVRSILTCRGCYNHREVSGQCSYADNTRSLNLVLVGKAIWRMLRHMCNFLSISLPAISRVNTRAV